MKLKFTKDWKYCKSIYREGFMLDKNYESAEFITVIGLGDSKKKF